MATTVLLLVAFGLSAGAPPGEVDAVVAKVRTLLDEDRCLDALREARKQAALLTGEPRVRTVLAETLYRAGRFEELEPLAVAQAEREAPSPRDLLTLGRLRLAHWIRVARRQH